MAHFTYTELANAEHDLALFSRMNANEDKPLYLITVPGGMQIIKDPEITVDRIEAIGLNGKVFVGR